jgi:hypothetical protein
MNLLDSKNETVQIIYLVAAFVVLFVIFKIIRWYNNRKSVEPERSDSIGSNSSFIQDQFAPYGNSIYTRKPSNEGGRRMRKKYSKNKNKK